MSAKALVLLDMSVSDDALLNTMIEHPVLVNRPIVCNPRDVRLCRASETVLDLLKALPPGPLYKAGGKQIMNEKGERVD